MARHVHVHIHTAHTRDAGFDESAHPRDHGKFTSGSGSSAPAKKGPVDRETTVGKAAHQLSDKINSVAKSNRKSGFTPKRP